MSQPHSFSDMAEAELAEADQIHDTSDTSPAVEPQPGHRGCPVAGSGDQPVPRSCPVVSSISAAATHSFPVRDPDSPLRPASGGHGLPLMVGLDRVPIRLPSTGGW